MNPKEIEELANYLGNEKFSQQAKNDKLDHDIIRQQHVLEAQKDAKINVVAVGTGYGKLVRSQNFSFLSSRPFIAFNAPRDTLKQHAEFLEAANQGMWKLSGAYLAWLRGIQDVVDVGRGFLLVHSLPKLWKGLEFERGDESDKEYTDRLDDLKLANWPIIVSHQDVRQTWPTFTLKRELDQVVAIKEMTARQVEEAYGSKFGREKDTDKVKVIVYADHHEMRTIIAKHGGVMGVGSTSAEDALDSWKHGMKMNPYILMEAPPLPDNNEGVMWEGSIAPLRYLVPEMDGALTDWRHNTKRNTHSNMVLNLNLADRKQDSPNAQSNADLIKIGPDGIVYLDLEEKISDYAGSQTNPDIPGVISAMRSFTQEGAIRPALLGILEQAGDSGVRYNTGAQLAQKQFGPALDYLSVAAENVTRHLFAGITSFSETFKDIGLEDDKIPIYFVDSDGISQRKKLSASDVKGWENRQQAKLELAIPLQENAEIMTARLAADPVGGVMSLETAMERYAHIANPLEEIRKRDLDKIRAALVEQRVQAAQQIAQQIASTPANADILAQDFAAQPDSVKQGIQMAAQLQGQAVPEARAAANSVREGRGQQPSQTQATGGVPRA
ncbi:hypothetical protein LCGC14_0792900 [marine sediment metagenome]|uniref:Portal protein n=1 Tax=marine sediment metagenome TaxID=412755 RepID=A0A0F9PRY0_9ZZZZ